MPGTAPLLDMVASLVSLYALASMLCWAAGDALAVMTGTRSRAIARRIERICGSEEDADAARELAARILRHPVAGGANPGGPRALSPSLFAAALLDVLADRVGEPHPQAQSLIEAAPTRHLRDALAALTRDGEDDLASLEARIADWYTGCAGSPSETDSRRLALLLGIGFVVAAAFNLDAVAITHAAWVASVAPGAASGLPLGWEYAGDLAGSPTTILLKIFGFAISALALCSGIRLWAALAHGPLIHRIRHRLAGRPSSQAPSARHTAGSVEAAESAYEASNLTRDDVIGIQRALGLRGRFVSGVIDVQTRALVEDFQLSVGRRPTGVLTPYLVERLLAQSTR